MNELLVKQFNPTLSVDTIWPRFRANIKHLTVFRNLRKQILERNHFAEDRRTIMCAGSEKSVHTQFTVNSARALRWQQNDITSIDVSITDVIVYRVYSVWVLTGINSDGIIQYRIIYQLGKISMSHDRIDTCWFKSCCRHNPTIRLGNVISIIHAQRNRRSCILRHMSIWYQEFIYCP